MIPQNLTPATMMMILIGNFFLFGSIQMRPERLNRPAFIQGVFFSSSLVPSNFSTKKKTANQPIRAAVPVNPVSKKGRDWLLGGFSFWY